MYDEIEGAKFKKGDHVKIKACVDKNFVGHVDKVIGVNDTGDGIEYAVFDYDWLLWENELE